MKAYIFFAILFAILFALYFYYDKFLQYVPIHKGIKFFVIIGGMLSITFPIIIKNIDKLKDKDGIQKILEKKYKAKN